MAIWNERIKKRRKEKHITLKEVAEYIGVTEATAQRYESGNGIKNIPYDMVVRYSELLDCSPSYLMGWEDEKKTADNMHAISNSYETEKLVEITKTMQPEQLQRLLEYAEFLTTKKEGN